MHVERIPAVVEDEDGTPDSMADLVTLVDDQGHRIVYATDVTLTNGQTLRFTMNVTFE